MEKLSSRKVNALVLFGCGVLLLNAPQALVPLAPADANLLRAGLSALVFPGLFCFCLGIYRFFTQGKKE